LTTYLGVCGWPVAHSRSPQMHNAALAAVGLHDWRYLRLPLPPDLFAETVRALPAAGFRGVNVTIPHKHAALALADAATDAAREIGAANTLTFEGGAIHADNTDAPGLLAALGEPVAGRRALVLAAALGVRAVEGWEEADVIINCTSVGLHDSDAPFKALPLGADEMGAGSLVVDMVYRVGGTRFLEAARTRGARVVDGLEILVAQGAASFERWTGREAPRVAMREAATTIATT
jgi:shikimate dehydrogenase